jgi:hypothetical protein
MEETRTALADKLETLEQQVVGTVQNATEAVTDIVDTTKETVEQTMHLAKESVHEAVETVKETLDLSRQVERHPWAMWGGSVALGYLLGSLLGKSRSHRASYRGWSPAYALAEQSRFAVERNGEGRGAVAAEGESATKPSPAAATSTPEKQAEPSFLSEISEKFGSEISKLKGLAVGTLMGVLRDMISNTTPEPLRKEVANVIDSATLKLGGKPIAGPLIPTPSQEASSRGSEGHESRATVSSCLP